MDATVVALRRHIGNPGVQEAGCAALRHLAYNNDNNKASISRSGGIEAVINALRRHPDHAVVQEAACAALYNLSFNIDNQLAIAKVGGIECIAIALRRHQDHAGVQQNGCGALSRLACNDSVRGQILASDASDAVRRAMRMFPTVDTVRDCAKILGI